jgi:phage shock protein A
MARQSRKDYSSRLAEYQRQLEAAKKALAQVLKGNKDLDLKIKNLKKQINALTHHPFKGSPKA